MVIPEAKHAILRRCIEQIYSGPVSEERLTDLAPRIAEIADSHYFSVLLYPNGFVSNRKYVSNNFQSYSKLYSSLIPKDFLLRNMLNQNSITLLSGFSIERLLDNSEFCTEAVRGRPITDICYVPIKIRGYLAGHAAVARAGMNRRMQRSLHLPRLDAANDPFSENDVRLIRFVTGFVHEGLKRLMEPPSEEEDSACLDLYGRVVTAGEQFRKIMKLLFGKRFWNVPGLRASASQADGVEGEGAAAFSSAFRKFLSGSLQPGDGEVSVNYKDRQFRFVFERLPSADLRVYFPGEPQVTVRVQESGKAATPRISGATTVTPEPVLPEAVQKLQEWQRLTPPGG